MDNKIKYRGHYFSQEIQTEYLNGSLLRIYTEESDVPEIQLKGELTTFKNLKTVADLLEQIVASQVYYYNDRLRRVSVDMSRASSCSSLTSLESASEMGVDKFSIQKRKFS
jgi:hypothetical protein